MIPFQRHAERPPNVLVVNGASSFVRLSGPLTTRGGSRRPTGEIRLALHGLDLIFRTWAGLEVWAGFAHVLRPSTLEPSS